jgi:hypothetical protein
MQTMTHLNNRKAASVAGRNGTSAQAHYELPRAPHTRTVLVTPELAQEWLAKNEGNRPLRQHVVQIYATDIAAGKWQMNGETIKLAASGRVLDGQHRLQAIVKTGASVEMLVVFGLPEDSFQTIDTGMRRTMAHILGFNGAQNCGVLASIGRWIAILGQGSEYTRTNVSSQTVLDMIQQHPLSQHYATKFSNAAVRALLPAASGAVMTLAAEKYGQDVIDLFMSNFASGEGLKSGDPVFELRERMIQNRARVAKLQTPTVVALTIKAIRAYALQRQVGVLRWAPNEEWPTL